MTNLDDLIGELVCKIESRIVSNYRAGLNSHDNIRDARPLFSELAQAVAEDCAEIAADAKCHLTPCALMRGYVICSGVAQAIRSRYNLTDNEVTKK